MSRRTLYNMLLAAGALCVTAGSDSLRKVAPLSATTDSSVQSLLDQVLTKLEANERRMAEQDATIASLRETIERANSIIASRLLQVDTEVRVDANNTKTDASCFPRYISGSCVFSEPVTFEADASFDGVQVTFASETLFSGDVNVGIVNVGGLASFNGDSIFEGSADFNGEVNFYDDVTVEGKHSGTDFTVTDRVNVVFEKDTTVDFQGSLDAATIAVSGQGTMGSLTAGSVKVVGDLDVGGYINGNDVTLGYFNGVGLFEGQVTPGTP